MKRVSSLFMVVVVLAGASMGNVVGNTAAGECPIVLEEGETLSNKFDERVEDCSQENVRSSGVQLLVEKNSTSEETRTAFRTYCESVSRHAYSQCMDALTTDVSVCFNETERTKFRLLRQFKELEYELGCHDNGNLMAKIFEAVTSNSFRLPEMCRQNATVELGTADNQDPNGWMVFEYKVIEKLMACLSDNKSEENESLMSTLISVGREILDRMNCLKDGTDVLCKTIIGNNN